MTKRISSSVISCVLITVLVQPAAKASRSASQDPVQQGTQLLKLAADENQRNHAQALATASKALAQFQTAQDNTGIAKSYGLIGRCHLAMSNLTEATANYQQALKLWQSLNDAKEQAETLIMLAMVEQRKGDWTNALSYYNQAEALGQNDPYQAGQIATGIGDLLNETGLQESALVQFHRALENYQQARDKRAVNNTLINIGYTKFLLQDYAGAIQDLETALASFEPSSLDVGWCQEHLGRIHLALRQYPLALQYLEPALANYDRAGNPTETERVRSLIAQTYEEQGELAQARSRYLQALKVFRGLQDRINESLVSFRLGHLELKAGHLDEAENYLKESLQDTEELRTISLGRDITTAYSASVHDRYEAYIACLLRKSKLSGSPALSEQAFAASELSRARAMLELLRDTHTNLLAGVDPQLAEREKTLRQLIRVKMDSRLKLLTTVYNKNDLSAVQSDLDRLRAEHQQLSQQLANLNPAYSQITQPTAYSLKQIQNEVIDDDQTALVEYILADEVSYVWVVTRNSIKVTELAGEATITKAVQNAYTLLSAKPQPDNAEQVNKALEHLSTLVITPIADQLPARRLIVVADGALNYIPFQVLPLPSDKQPLIASREIVNAPSASILGQLRLEKSQRPTPENVVAAFGYPAFPSNYAELKGTKNGEEIAQLKKEDDASWSTAMRDIELTGDDLDTSTIQPLIYSRKELSALADVAGPASFFATGFNASRETLQRTDLSEFAILHFATHGVLDPNKPEKSGFLLSLVGPDGQPQNGFITVQDVYQLHAPVSVVVLSACRTGLGKDIRGEGLISLTRGFMYAGASSVAASLWNVNDEVTAELMKQFYTNMLQKGLTPAAALRAAQNTIRQQPQWRSPHYWAAFTLQGEYEQPVQLPARFGYITIRRIVTVLIVLLALSALGWWFWRLHRGSVHSTRNM